MKALRRKDKKYQYHGQLDNRQLYRFSASAIVLPYVSGFWSGIKQNVRNKLKENYNIKRYFL